MKYLPQLILMPTDDGIENVTAIAAEGTGLSYHRSDKGCIILSQNMGYKSIAPACICKDEHLARLFIHELRKVTDWTKDEETIRIDMFCKYAYLPDAIEGRIQRAFNDAVAKYDKSAVPVGA
jgi:hypothetical protein